MRVASKIRIGDVTWPNLKTVTACFALNRRAALADPGAEPDSPYLEPCRRCRVAYRLVGIERTDKPQDLYTFECQGCGQIEVRVVRMQ